MTIFLHLLPGHAGARRKTLYARGRIALSGGGLRPLGPSAYRHCGSVESARKPGTALPEVKDLRYSSAVARLTTKYVIRDGFDAVFLPPTPVCRVCRPPGPPRAYSACGSAAARYYDGPVSDHFDGTRFFDVNGAPPRSPLDSSLRWRLSNWRGAMAGVVAEPLQRRPAGARRRGGMAHLGCGHASVLLQTST